MQIHVSEALEATAAEKQKLHGIRFMFRFTGFLATSTIALFAQFPPDLMNPAHIQNGPVTMGLVGTGSVAFLAWDAHRSLRRLVNPHLLPSEETLFQKAQAEICSTAFLQGACVALGIAGGALGVQSLLNLTTIQQTRIPEVIEQVRPYVGAVVPWVAAFGFSYLHDRMKVLKPTAERFFHRANQRRREAIRRDQILAPKAP
jgi:hypothetical protein